MVSGDPRTLLCDDLGDGAGMDWAFICAHGGVMTWGMARFLFLFLGTSAPPYQSTSFLQRHLIGAQLQQGPRNPFRAL